jgi:hypothetical protein
LPHAGGHRETVEKADFALTGTFVSSVVDAILLKRPNHFMAS